MHFSQSAVEHGIAHALRGCPLTQAQESKFDAVCRAMSERIKKLERSVDKFLKNQI